MKKTIRELIAFYNGKIEVLQDIVSRLEDIINNNDDSDYEQEEKVFDEIV